jgi:hypothetical protein
MLMHYHKAESSPMESEGSSERVLDELLGGKMRYLQLLAIVGVFAISASFAQAQNGPGYSDPGYGNQGKRATQDTAARETSTKAMGTREMAIRGTLTRVIPGYGDQGGIWSARLQRASLCGPHLQCTLTATMTMPRMRARLMATTARAGSPAGCLSELARGGVGAAAAGTADADTTAGAGSLADGEASLDAGRSVAASGAERCGAGQYEAGR